MKALFQALLFFVMTTGLVQQSWALQCRTFLKPFISTEFTPGKPLRFMSLNTLNLYLHQGKYLWTDRGLEKVDQDKLPRQKPEKHTQGLADTILDTKPDFIMLQEVEGRESLERFNRRFLNRAYQVYMPETNDGRKLGTAFLVRRGTGVKVKRKSNHQSSWTNKDGQVEKIFTRNFPVFELYVEDHQVPKLIVAGVHYKSQRDRAEDPGSFYKRKREAEESTKILKRIKKKHPNTPIIVMGDFNSNQSQKELGSFRDMNMVDLNDHPQLFQDEGGLGNSTFVFFKDGVVEPQTEALDGAFISPDLLNHLQSFKVYRYKDENGKIIPLPKNYAERNRNPSDHYPVIFDLNPEVLYEDYLNAD